MAPRPEVSLVGRAHALLGLEPRQSSARAGPGVLGLRGGAQLAAGSRTSGSCHSQPWRATGSLGNHQGWEGVSRCLANL